MKINILFMLNVVSWTMVSWYHGIMIVNIFSMEMNCYARVVYQEETFQQFCGGRFRISRISRKILLELCSDSLTTGCINIVTTIARLRMVFISSLLENSQLVLINHFVMTIVQFGKFASEFQEVIEIHIACVIRVQ